MKITVETNKFKEMVARASKGSATDKLFEITKQMWICAKDGKLMVVTNDGTNYLYVIDDGYEEEFDCVVATEMFSKLIQKITSETITMEVKDNIITVVGNGTYNIGLELDNGEPIKYPNPVDSIKLKGGKPLDMTLVRRVLSSVKPSLANTMNTPSIANYFVGESVFATNRNIVTSLKHELFGDTEMLVSPAYMNLLDVITDDDVQYITTEDYTVTYSDRYILFGANIAGVDEYPIDILEKFIETEFDYTCYVDKQSILATLDRMSLFVGAFGDTTVNLLFDKDGLTISNRDETSSELIEYYKKGDVKKFACKIDSVWLETQIKSYSGDVVEIQYGEDNCIKLAYEDMTQIISLHE